MGRTPLPRLEYRLYLNNHVDYYDIIPQMEQKYRQRFRLNKYDGNYIMCFTYEYLLENEKWAKYCECLKIKEGDYSNPVTTIPVDKNYRCKKTGDWVSVNENTTWSEIWENDYTSLNTKLLPDPPFHIICGEPFIEELMEFMSIKDDFFNMTNADTEKSGWYYNCPWL